MAFIDNLIGQLAPHDCLGCREESALLCWACGLGLPGAFESGAVGNLASVSAVTSYHGVAKELVRRLKFRGAVAAAGVMARQMAQLVPADVEGALIVAVPTATRRVRQRGFDQAALLARQLARRTGMQYAACLRRYGQTHQVGATREQRLSQLEGAFGLRPHADLCGQPILLVDDVVTTGATLETAAAVLKSAGAGPIHAIVFAQAEWRAK